MRDPRGGFLRRPFCEAKLWVNESERQKNKVVTYASGSPRVIVRVVIVDSFPLTTPAVDLGRTIAIVVISAGCRRLKMTIPIWEVGLLVGLKVGLNLEFGLVVPFGTVVRFMGACGGWRRVSVIGNRVGRFGGILTKREGLLAGNWDVSGGGGRAVSGLVP